MDIDDNASHESEGLQQHDPDEAESSVSMDELDRPPVLIESDDERDDIESSEEGDGEDEEEEEEEDDDDEEDRSGDIDLTEPIQEDDLEDLLNMLRNMQGHISFLAVANSRHKTAEALGGHLCFISLQITV